MRPLAALLLVSLASAQSRLADPALSTEIRQASERLGAGVFVYAKNIDTGAWFGAREDEKVSTASTIKLPILATLFDKAAKDQLRWDETLELTAASRVGGSGILGEFSAGLRFPIRDLANLMIVVSDNTATNLILDRISAESVNAYLDSIGLTQTRSLRKVLSGNPPKPSGLSKAGQLEANQQFGIGVSTAREMATLMELIANGKAVSAEASQQMLAILARQHYKDGIGRRLGEFKVASKSGSLSSLRSDVALVTTPKGRIVIAITVEGLKNALGSVDNPGLLLIGDLARKLTDALLKAAP